MPIGAQEWRVRTGVIANLVRRAHHMLTDLRCSGRPYLVTMVRKFSLHLHYDVIPAHWIKQTNTWAVASQELENL